MIFTESGTPLNYNHTFPFTRPDKFRLGGPCSSEKLELLSTIMKLVHLPGQANLDDGQRYYSQKVPVSYNPTFPSARPDKSRCWRAIIFAESDAPLNYKHTFPFARPDTFRSWQAMKFTNKCGTSQI